MLTTVQVEDPEDGYTKTTYNAAGQRTKTEITATESGGSPTSWKTAAEYYYDQATPGSGSSKGGPGNLTQVKRYYGDSSSNSTSFTYDWHNRRLFNGPPAGLKTLWKYDNLGRVVAVGTFTNATSLSTSDDPTTKTSGRLGLSETSYNNRGQVYQTKRWEITASTGAKGSDLVTDTYYDRNGRVVAFDSPGGGIQVTKYGPVGNVIQRQVCTSLGNTVYSSGTFDYSNDNKIVEFTKLSYRNGQVPAGQPYPYDGLPQIVARYELKSNVNTTIDPSSPGTDTVADITRHWYDDADRRTTTSRSGSTKGGLAGPMQGETSATPTYDPNSPAGRSDTSLTTTWTYGDDGRLKSVADPDNIKTEYEYDDIGRRTAMVEDKGTGGGYLNRRTEYEYDGNSDITKLIARDVGEYGYDPNDANEDQVTQYVYGQGINNRWVTEIRYPGSNGQASSASADKVVFTYNHDGTVATRTDQNGSVITYEYDTLRRKTHERVTTVGSGVDNAVLQNVTSYDSNGRAEKITQRDSATKDSGSVVNEVKFSYDGLGQLTKDEQDPNGVVNGSTLAVQYAYDASSSSSNNYSRLNYMTYPNGRIYRWRTDLSAWEEVGPYVLGSYLPHLVSRPGAIYSYGQAPGNPAAGIYESVDLGQSWQQLAALEDPDASALHIHGDTLYVGTGRDANDIAYIYRMRLEEVLALDIKPRSCPNPFNRKSQGVLPVAVLGTVDFDVTTIDVSTVRLARADGVGGEVAPLEGPPSPHSVFEDVATPFGGEPCDCHDLGADGYLDLSMKFSSRDVVAALELEDVPGGTELELVVSGSLLDETAFVAHDCIVLRPSR